MSDGARIDLRESPDSDPDPKSLVSLLGDPSPATGRAVRGALLQLGEAARKALLAASGGADTRTRARARQLLLDIDQAAALRRLELYFERSADDDERGAEPSESGERGSGIDRGSGLDLRAGLGRIDDHLADGVNSTALREAVDERLDAFSGALSSELEAVTGGASRTATAAIALRVVLGDRADFRGPEGEFNHQSRVSLARTIEDRQGLPLTLCAVYALVARRAGLEAGLLPFPGHVLLALGPIDDRLVLDPFHGGTVLSREDRELRLRAYGAPPTPLWHQVGRDRQMVLRQTRNLAAAMRHHGRQALAREAIALADRTAWD